MVWESRNGEWGNFTARVTDPARLEALVRERGINMTARQVGCSGATISLIASGKRGSCTVDLATRIARVLQVRRDEIFAVETVGQTEQPVRPEATSVPKTA